MQTASEKKSHLISSAQHLLSEEPASLISNHKLKIWVLAPHLETNDEQIDYYYDFSQSIAEYTKIFSELEIDWKWQRVTMTDFSDIIDNIANESSEKIKVILNLCDGDEINGTPGISVIKKLESKNLVYTGSEEYFYHITTSKVPMKIAFDNAHVPTAKWEMISSKGVLTDKLFDILGTPIILKPSVSGGSMGVGIKNVVDNQTALDEQLKKMFDGYRGWNLSIDGIIAEEYIAGREFTILITGSSRHENTCRVYEPVERVFHSSLPTNERFLSFDRLWEIYEDEPPMPNHENFYEYKEVDPSMAEEIKKISLDAYRSVQGTGYTRIDIRQDEKTNKLYVLEVNAQCGLSEDEDYTSIGAILRVNKTSFKDMIIEIIQDAFNRKENK
jgi:D-alanine-D-alanine ligase